MRDRFLRLTRFLRRTGIHFAGKRFAILELFRELLGQVFAKASVVSSGERG